MNAETPQGHSSSASSGGYPVTGPGALPGNHKEKALEQLGWGLFCRYICSQAGVLFLLASFVCFFAFNWHGLTTFTKFGLLGGLILAGLFCFIYRGPDSAIGGICLFGCGLLAGPLMAVFGQAYQTGANAYELFLVWAALLLPLALVSGRTALWLFCWLLATLSFWLYLFEWYAPGWDRWDPFSSFLIMPLTSRYMLYVQTGMLVAWEACAYLLAGPSRPFLFSRLVPRMMALLIFTHLTWTFCRFLFFTLFHNYYGESVTAVFFMRLLWIYPVYLLAAAYWYTRRTPDILIIGLGLLSMIISLMFFIYSQESTWNAGGAFLGAMVLILCAALAARIIRLCLRWTRPARQAWRNRHSQADRLRSERSAHRKRTRAANRLLPALWNFGAIQFALTGRLPGSPEELAAEEEAEHSPWFLRVILGICAWLTLPLLLALLYFLFDTLLLEFWATFGLSAAAMVAAAILCRAPGFFLGQFALALALAGTAGVCVSLIFDYRIPEETVLLPVILSSAAGFLAIRLPAYRFGAAAAFILALIWQVNLNYFEPNIWYLDQDTNLGGHVAGAIGFSLFSILLVSLYCLPVPKKRRAWLVPMRTGFLAALMLSPLPEISAYFPFLLGAGTGAGLGLAWLTWNLLKATPASPAAWAFFLLASALIAALSWLYPWIGVGILALALGRKAGSIPLQGLAAAYLILMGSYEYYLQNTSLLIKSMFQGATGLLMLGAAAVLNRFLAGGVANGSLPDPLALLERYRKTDSAAPVSAGDARYAGTALPLQFRWRELLAGLAVFGFLLSFCFSVAAKERLLREGTVMFLELVPVDPRSIMLGDYMTLNSSIEGDISRALDTYYSTGRGTAVVTLSEDRKPLFVRIEKEGEPLAAGEHRLAFKYTLSGVQVGSGAFFFQEGHAEYYEEACFAEVRVDDSGGLVLAFLLDRNKDRILPERQER